MHILKTLGALSILTVGCFCQLKTSEKIEDNSFPVQHGSYSSSDKLLCISSENNIDLKADTLLPYVKKLVKENKVEFVKFISFKINSKISIEIIRLCNEFKLQHIYFFKCIYEKDAFLNPENISNILSVQMNLGKIEANVLNTFIMSLPNNIEKLQVMENVNAPPFIEIENISRKILEFKNLEVLYLWNTHWNFNRIFFKQIVCSKLRYIRVKGEKTICEFINGLILAVSENKDWKNDYIKRLGLESKHYNPDFSNQNLKLLEKLSGLKCLKLYFGEVENEIQKLNIHMTLYEISNGGKNFPYEYLCSWKGNKGDDPNTVYYNSINQDNNQVV